jgi:hypothetical protein
MPHDRHLCMEFRLAALYIYGIIICKGPEETCDSLGRIATQSGLAINANATDNSFVAPASCRRFCVASLRGKSPARCRRYDCVVAT